MKEFLLVATLLVGPAVVFAQSGAQRSAQSVPRAAVPGHPDCRGQPIQGGQPNPAAETGGLDPATIMKPLKDEWTSYSGDLSGKRYSALKLVNTATVKNLSLKWVNTMPTGCGATGTAPVAAGAGGGRGGPGGGGGGGGRGGGGGGSITPIVVGGLGNGEANNCGNRGPGGGILFVD